MGFALYNIFDLFWAIFLFQANYQSDYGYFGKLPGTLDLSLLAATVLISLVQKKKEKKRRDFEYLEHGYINEDQLDLGEMKCPKVVFFFF